MAQPIGLMALIGRCDLLVSTRKFRRPEGAMSSRAKLVGAMLPWIADSGNCGRAPIFAPRLRPIRAQANVSAVFNQEMVAP
jgi:hypothetical protein